MTPTRAQLEDVLRGLDGVRYADVRYTATRQQHVKVRNGEVDHLSSTIDRAIGVRVLVGVAPVRLENVAFELRKVAGADESVALHEKRRVDLRVALLSRVEIEHERDERPLEARALSPQDREARPRELGGARLVQDAERFADLPVRLRLEVERGLFADHPHDGIFRVAPAIGNTVVRHVRNDEQALLRLETALYEELKVR